MRRFSPGAIWAVRPRPAANSSPNDAERFANAVKGWLPLEASPNSKPILITNNLLFPRLAAAVSDALWFSHPEAPWCIQLPRLSKSGRLDSKETRSGLCEFLDPLFVPTPNNLPAASEQRALRVVDVLSSEPRIVVTDIEPPTEDNVLHPALAAHRWVMPDNGVVSSRVDERGKAEIKLDITDSRTPTGSTISVPAIWGLYRGEPSRAEANAPA